MGAQTTTPLDHSSSPLSLRRFLRTKYHAKAKHSPHLQPERHRSSPERLSSTIAIPLSTRSPLPSRSPISHVPTELLTQIFSHVPRIEFEESFRAGPVPPKPMWMVIVQVCRLWRAIATNCKEFWSYIPLQASAYWVEVSLARSYPYPIFFRVDFSTARPEWYRRAALSALQAIGRAREVYLHSSSAAINLEFRREALRLLDVSSAPKLQTLSIQSANMSRDSVPVSGKIFLRRIATALHVLTLAYCDIGPSSLLLRAPLVSLRLKNCQVESPLEILSLLRQLRTLVLENTHGTRLKDLSDVVHLPQLQQLQLTNISSIIVFVLKGIRPPASVSLSIVCTDYMDIDEPLDDVTLLRTIVFTISPVLSTYLERALEEGYVHPLLEIATPADTSKKTVALLGRTSPTPTTESCQLHFSVVWGDASGSTDLFSQMLSVLPAAALRHVHILRMRDNALRAADARSRLRSLAQFHDKARDEAVQGLLAIVTQQGLLPALRQIAFEGVDFEHLDVDLLARVLVLRRRVFEGEGAKIRLSLRGCLVSQGTIAALRDCLGSDADTVDWE